MAAMIFDDLSGTATPVSESDNPHQPLIEASSNDPVQLQARYAAHRTTRNELQRAKILSPSFSGWTLDPILAKLDGPNISSTFVDERFCLVFWGRPPRHIRNMIDMIQQEMRSIAPTMWFMPLNNLHITVMEVIHSITEPEMEGIVSTLLRDGAAEEIANTTFGRRTRLIKPMISYDAAAMALSFVPAAGEGRDSISDDTYTYHHLRRDIFDGVKAAGFPPASRYAVPSAHLTIGRFITQDGFQDSAGQVDRARVKEVVDMIDHLNARLQAQYWPTEDGEIPVGGDWTVGQEKGLDFRKGRLWYGGGQTIVLGKGY